MLHNIFIYNSWLVLNFLFTIISYSKLFCFSHWKLIICSITLSCTQICLIIINLDRTLGITAIPYLDRVIINLSSWSILKLVNPLLELCQVILDLIFIY